MCGAPALGLGLLVIEHGTSKAKLFAAARAAIVVRSALVASSVVDLTAAVVREHLRAICEGASCARPLLLLPHNSVGDTLRVLLARAARAAARFKVLRSVAHREVHFAAAGTPHRPRSRFLLRLSALQLRALVVALTGVGPRVV